MSTVLDARMAFLGKVMLDEMAPVSLKPKEGKLVYLHHHKETKAQKSLINSLSAWKEKNL